MHTQLTITWNWIFMNSCSTYLALLAANLLHLKENLLPASKPVLLYFLRCPVVPVCFRWSTDMVCPTLFLWPKCWDIFTKVHHVRAIWGNEMGITGRHFWQYVNEVSYENGRQYYFHWHSSRHGECLGPIHQLAVVHKGQKVGSQAHTRSSLPQLAIDCQIDRLSNSLPIYDLDSSGYLFSLLSYYTDCLSLSHLLSILFFTFPWI